MKRDFDLIRRILRDVEASPGHTAVSVFQYDGYDVGVVGEHVDILIEAGLLQGKVTPILDGKVYFHVKRLTWAGHDFLDAMKDDGIWAKAKESILKPVGGVAFDVLLEWLKWQMKTKLGLPG